MSDNLQQSQGSDSHFSVNQVHDCSAYLLSIAALTSPLPEGGQLPFYRSEEGERLGWPTCALGEGLNPQLHDHPCCEAEC